MVWSCDEYDTNANDCEGLVRSIAAGLATDDTDEEDEEEAEEDEEETEKGYCW